MLSVKHRFNLKALKALLNVCIFTYFFFISMNMSFTISKQILQTTTEINPCHAEQI